MKLLITRTDFEDKQTLGNIQLFDDGGSVVWSGKTLELPWKDNHSRVSCIPEGVYKLVHRSAFESKAFKYDHFHVLDVPGRTYILIHAGNYHTQILGCILPGKTHSDINGDGYRDVTSSNLALSELVALTKKTESIELEIRRVGE